MEGKLESQTHIAAPTYGPAGTTAAAPFTTAGGDAITTKQKKVRTPYPLHKTRWVTRAITFVAEFIAFFLIVGMSRNCGIDSINGGCSVLFELVFVGIPMIWNIAEFITLCVNRKGIHPGAHIALDLILFGLLVGPAGILIAIYAYNPRYYYDCSASGPCVRTLNTQRTSNFRAIGLASGIFMTIAGLLHLALFIMACISVHRWRRQRRDQRFQLMQAAYRQPQSGAPISIAGHMDPNMAYLVTYPDGRQVLVPPPGQQQQQQQPGQVPQQYGYYAPPGQAQGPPSTGFQQFPGGQAGSVAPVMATTVGAGAGAAAGHMAPRSNVDHSPVSQISVPHDNRGSGIPSQHQQNSSTSTSFSRPQQQQQQHDHGVDYIEAPSMGATPRPVAAVPDHR